MTPLGPHTRFGHLALGAARRTVAAIPAPARRRVARTVRNVRDLLSPPHEPPVIPIGSPVEAAYYRNADRHYICDVPVGSVQFTDLVATWVETLQRYRDEGTDAARQHLGAWFTSTAPHTVADVVGLEPTTPYLRGDPLTTTYPWSDRSPAEALADRRRVMTTEAGANGFPSWDLADGWRSFGPASEALVHLEVGRLTGIYDSVVRHGFDHRKGVILGRVRIADDTCMVTPAWGWHRTAVLLALGAEHLPMRFNPGLPVVRRSDVAWWPNVVNGLFSVDDALAVFDHQFTGPGPPDDPRQDNTGARRVIHTY